MSVANIEIRDLPEQLTVVIRHRITMQEVGQIPGWLGETFGAIQRGGLTPAGVPFLRTLSMDTNGMDVEVGWPVATPFAGDGEIHASSLPAGPAAVATYYGPYDGIASAYAAVQTWCADHGREVAGPPWESYFTDPNGEPDQSKWRTDVHFPVRE